MVLVWKWGAIVKCRDYLDQWSRKIFFRIVVQDCWSGCRITFLLISFWLRLVFKVGVEIGPDLTKYFGVKATPERSHVVVASHNIFKCSCKAVQ